MAKKEKTNPAAMYGFEKLKSHAQSLSTPTPSPVAPSPIVDAVPLVVLEGSHSRSSNIAPVKPAPTEKVHKWRPSFYLYPEDDAKLRMLAGYLNTHFGLKATDSLLLRAALEHLAADQRLVDTIKRLALKDNRKTRFGASR